MENWKMQDQIWGKVRGWKMKCNPQIWSSIFSAPVIRSRISIVLTLCFLSKCRLLATSAFEKLLNEESRYRMTVQEQTID